MQTIFEDTICGIDYGSKLAGTTVIATLAEGQISLTGSRKKQDADKLIIKTLAESRPVAVFLDAPLSLPMVYRQPDVPEADYFYRAADKALRAMSPMFLGGLTARAMRLAADLRRQGAAVYEAYPGALARELGLQTIDYKGVTSSIPGVIGSLNAYLQRSLFPEDVASWHAVDACLALTIGIRYRNGLHRRFGEAAEGVIVV